MISRVSAYLLASACSCKIFIYFGRICMLGVILAGGYSSRAKLNKLMLQINGEPLLFHTISSMRPFVDRLVVVTGYYHDELASSLSSKDVKIAYNKDFDQGMFSSILTGVKEASENDDLLLLPGDICGVSKKTFEALLSCKGKIRIPSYRGHDGHPLFLDRSLVNLVKKEPITSNMQNFLNRFENEKNHVDVDDPFVCVDIDTMEDYRKVSSMIERK